MRAVFESGRKWYSAHDENKYVGDQHINRENLLKEFPSMVRRLEQLQMQFLFYQPYECNLRLVREFYANWDPYNGDSSVQIRGQLVTFTPHTLNVLLGTPDADPQILKELYIQPPYRQIRHFLCGMHSSARWIRQRGTGIHHYFPYSHMNWEARIWAKIIYTCLLQSTHMTNVTHDRVCLIYALMRDDIDLNIGSIIFTGMNKAWLNPEHRYGFGGVITRFLRNEGVPEEDADFRPPIILKPLAISRTKGTDAYGLNLTMPEQLNRIEETVA
ncbi:uncharacterized protein LOC124897641 [Capsicum annuum]|uniref:uncharacterized protein LOC124897641 n=1 Tax=Capsicum annuum TaxID=4072 RepID=UPI001FB0CE9D|nr:uncharacterized protein LOC124897641 [Capsicum annuum]